MGTSNSFKLITELQAVIHKTIAPFVPSSGKFALLDFPNHGNVSNSSIWAGELQYFRTYFHMAPTYVSHCHNCSVDVLERLLPEGTIFLSGGGNFGDLWPAHQEFREHILEYFPNHKIVQLPQSIHFFNHETFERAANIIKEHPDFTLLVRDQRSLAIAKAAFNCDVQLCPDMAFCLGFMEKLAHPSHPLLLLMREDHEQAEEQIEMLPSVPDGVLATDWLKDEREMRPSFLIRATERFRLMDQQQRQMHYQYLAELRLKRGIELLSSAEYVITDRLHAHILCLLLDIPHTVLDNSYGKVSSFVSAWTHDSDITESTINLNTALLDYYNVLIPSNRPANQASL